MPWRGVCPRDIAISAIAALDCAFRRPRRLQPTTLPVAALWMAASIPPRHESHTSKFSVSTILATPLARMPILAPVTTRFRANPHPLCLPGSDRRQPRQTPAESRPNSRGLPSTTPSPSPQVRLRRYAHHPLSPLPVPVCQTCSRVKGGPPPTPARPTPPLTRCARPTVGTVRRESSATHGRTTWTRRPSREPSSGASTSAPASPPSRTKYPPEAGRVIVQCVDEIDEMQRWLEGRE